MSETDPNTTTPHPDTAASTPSPVNAALPHGHVTAPHATAHEAPHAAAARPQAGDFATNLRVASANQGPDGPSRSTTGHPEGIAPQVSAGDRTRHAGESFNSVASNCTCTEHGPATDVPAEYAATGARPTAEDDVATVPAGHLPADGPTPSPDPYADTADRLEHTLHNPTVDQLDDTTAAAYRHAVLNGRYHPEAIGHALGLTEEQTRRITRTLVQLHLLKPVPGRPDTLIPLSPDAATAELLATTEHHIQQLQNAVTHTRNRMQTLQPLYYESRQHRNHAEAFDIITDITTLQKTLNDHGLHAKKEILTAQPGGPRPPDILENARPRTLHNLQRGLTIKHLYQHTARTDLTTVNYIRTITHHGAHVRTTDQLIDRIIIYDRETVFLPEQNVTHRQPGAALIREPTLVQFLCKTYDHLWNNATPYTPHTPATPHITHNLKHAIIKLLAQGHKDENVARKLGMSVRTCRRHIAQIMEQANATSRFQTGANLALAGYITNQPPAAHTPPETDHGNPPGVCAPGMRDADDTHTPYGDLESAEPHSHDEI